MRSKFVELMRKHSPTLIMAVLDTAIFFAHAEMPASSAGMMRRGPLKDE